MKTCKNNVTLKIIKNAQTGERQRAKKTSSTVEESQGPNEVHYYVQASAPEINLVEIYSLDE